MPEHLDTETADLLVMEVKIPDHPTGHCDIKLTSSPSSKLWRRWNGTYNGPRGEQFDVTVQEHKLLQGKWTMILIHRSRFYGRNVLRRLDLGMHTDHVTGRIFSQVIPHLHVYRGDWQNLGYSDEAGYAEEFPSWPTEFLAACKDFINHCTLQDTTITYQRTLFP